MSTTGHLTCPPDALQQIARLTAERDMHLRYSGLARVRPDTREKHRRAAERCQQEIDELAQWQTGYEITKQRRLFK